MPLFKGVASKSTPNEAIRYVTDEKKAACISVRNLFEDEDYAEQFKQTMERFHKGKKYNERKYYHFKLSCARGDNVSAQESQLFAEELTARLFRDYECVIATHTDTQTVHSHIVVNAINLLSGKKLRITKTDYTAMKDEANRLGKEMGFSELDFRKKSKHNRTAEEQHIILKGGTSWKEELREVIVEAIKNSTTADGLKKYLKDCYGVEITRDGKDYSYLHPEKQKTIRGKTLGENYIKTEVIKKIDEQNNGRASTAHNGGRDGRFVGQRPSPKTESSGGRYNSTSKGIVIGASLSGIQREMQQLSFEAQCASRGTDAASEERRMVQRVAREEAERRRREALERREREQLQVDREPEGDAESNKGNGQGDRLSSKKQYGKGD